MACLERRTRTQRRETRDELEGWDEQGGMSEWVRMRTGIENPGTKTTNEKNEKDETRKRSKRATLGNGSWHERVGTRDGAREDEETKTHPTSRTKHQAPGIGCRPNGKQKGYNHTTREWGTGNERAGKGKGGNAYDANANTHMHINTGCACERWHEGEGNQEGETGNEWMKEKEMNGGGGGAPIPRTCYLRIR